GKACFVDFRKSIPFNELEVVVAVEPLLIKEGFFRAGFLYGAPWRLIVDRDSQSGESRTHARVDLFVVPGTLNIPLVTQTPQHGSGKCQIHVSWIAQVF